MNSERAFTLGSAFLVIMESSALKFYKLLLPNASSLSSPPQTLPTKKYLALQIQSQRLLLEHVTSDLLLQPEIAS